MMVRIHPPQLSNVAVGDEPTGHLVVRFDEPVRQHMFPSESLGGRGGAVRAARLDFPLWCALSSIADPERSHVVLLHIRYS
jgi:hypothetical protein